MAGATTACSKFQGEVGFDSTLSTGWSAALRAAAASPARDVLDIPESTDKRDVLRLTEPCSGAQVCDPQRVSADKERAISTLLPSCGSQSRAPKNLRRPRQFRLIVIGT